jgi:hypothetical protein
VPRSESPAASGRTYCHFGTHDDAFEGETESLDEADLVSVVAGYDGMGRRSRNRVESRRECSGPIDVDRVFRLCCTVELTYLDSFDVGLDFVDDRAER